MAGTNSVGLKHSRAQNLKTSSKINKRRNFVDLKGSLSSFATRLSQSTHKMHMLEVHALEHKT